MAHMNYEHKQRNEIKNAFFGHETFAIFTAAVYKEGNALDAGNKVDSSSDLRVWSAAFVCNETKHERNLAFACSNKLIDQVRNIVSKLTKINFWSDGCTK